MLRLPAPVSVFAVSYAALSSATLLLRDSYTYRLLVVDLIPVFLAASAAGAFARWYFTRPFEDSEQFKVTIGCLVAALCLDLTRLSLVLGIDGARPFVLPLLVTQVSIGGFLILGGLAIGNKLYR